MDLNKLMDLLIELRSASLSIQTGEDPKTIMKKYDMLFMGEKFNSINSIELHHSLKNVFNLDLTNEQLLEYIPTVCKILNMPIEGIQRLDNLGELSAYFITLH